jgi:predicted metalloendopeptidase
MNSRVLLSCLLVAGCGSKSPAPIVEPTPVPAPAGPAEPPAAAPGQSAEVANMDPSVKPGDDFYKYANGAWIANTEIPADRASYGVLAQVAELTAKRVVELIQQAGANAAEDTDAKKIGDYYASFMDEATIESKGLAPLQPTLDAINRVRDKVGLAQLLGATLRADVDALNAGTFYTDNLFGLWVAQDLSDPTKYTPFFLQGGLGMPDRDYYVDASPRMAEARDKYVAYIAAMLKLANIADADAKAKRVFALEMKIAKGHATRTESVDVQKANTHWAMKDLANEAPGLDWRAFVTAAGLAKATEVTVWHAGAVKRSAALVGSEPIGTWREYLAFHALDHHAAVLPRAFVELSFGFHGTTLNGTPQLRDRWKRAVDMTSNALGEAVGKLYVEKYFPASEKARVEGMVKNELAVFAQRIDKLAWMAPATKAKAKAKLDALKVGVGYPDHWRDYSGLKVVLGEALENLQRAERFEYARNVAKLGQPVDRGEWVMNPHLVNAVNLPAMNALNFPAAILQPPFLDPKRPIAMDYGATGLTIGHEISHSFDDQGAMFDATGKLKNWWTPEDLSHFQASSQQLVKQYNAYRPFPDLAVNGQLTLSENIADLAGLGVAYDAYRLAYGGKPAPAAGGFTGDQQFFISFAQVWSTKSREAALRQGMMTDGHSPPEFRGDTVRNLDAWYAAFGVQPGERLYLAPSDRVRIW